MVKEPLHVKQPSLTSCVKNLKWKPNIPTRGANRLPAFEKYESASFHPSSDFCDAILALVGHPPHSVWREIQ